jgi:hypothetical protein
VLVKVTPLRVPWRSTLPCDSLGAFTPAHGIGGFPPPFPPARSPTFGIRLLESGLACYSRAFRLSFPSPRRGSGTKRHSGAGAPFPKDQASVSDIPDRSPSFSEAL